MDGSRYIFFLCQSTKCRLQFSHSPIPGTRERTPRPSKMIEGWEGGSFQQSLLFHHPLQPRRDTEEWESQRKDCLIQLIREGWVCTGVHIRISVWCGYYWRWCKALLLFAGLAGQEKCNPAPFCLSTYLQSFNGNHGTVLHIAPPCGFREPPNTTCSLGIRQAYSSVGKWCARRSADVEDSGCSPD